MSDDLATGYRRRVLHSVEAFEIVECVWDHGGFSPMHDHGWSRCFVLVQEGRFENRLDAGGGAIETTYHSAGDAISTPVSARHEARCLSAGGGRTLHVYCPRIASEGPRVGVPPMDEVARAIDARLGPETLPWTEVGQLLAQVRAPLI